MNTPSGSPTHSDHFNSAEIPTFADLWTEGNSLGLPETTPAQPTNHEAQKPSSSQSKSMTTTDKLKRPAATGEGETVLARKRAKLLATIQAATKELADLDKTTELHPENTEQESTPTTSTKPQPTPTPSTSQSTSAASHEPPKTGGIRGGQDEGRVNVTQQNQLMLAEANEMEAQLKKKMQEDFNQFKKKMEEDFNKAIAAWKAQSKEKYATERDEIERMRKAGTEMGQEDAKNPQTDTARQ